MLELHPLDQAEGAIYEKTLPQNKKKTLKRKDVTKIKKIFVNVE